MESADHIINILEYTLLEHVNIQYILTQLRTQQTGITCTNRNCCITTHQNSQKSYVTCLTNYTTTTTTDNYYTPNPLRIASRAARINSEERDHGLQVRLGICEYCSNDSVSHDVN